MAESAVVSTTGTLCGIPGCDNFAGPHMRFCPTHTSKELLKECSVPGCRAVVHRDFLMCAAHWRIVPRMMQQEVNSAWAAFKRDKLNRALLHGYTNARATAIDYVRRMTETRIRRGNEEIDL